MGHRDTPKKNREPPAANPPSPSRRSLEPSDPRVLAFDCTAVLEITTGFAGLGVLDKDSGLKAVTLRCSALILLLYPWRRKWTGDFGRASAVQVESFKKTKGHQDSSGVQSS